MIFLYYKVLSQQSGLGEAERMNKLKLTGSEVGLPGFTSQLCHWVLLPKRMLMTSPASNKMLGGVNTSQYK